MTDYRDPNYRDPNPRDPYLPRESGLPPDGQPWPNATWGWIAGIAVVVLVLVFVFGRGGDRVATDTTTPPVTTGQRTMPPPPPTGPKLDSPATPVPSPAPKAPQPPSETDVR